MRSWKITRKRNSSLKTLMNSTLQSRPFLLFENQQKTKNSEVVTKLVEEYKAAERTDYLEWGQEGAKGEEMQL